ncbi:MAG: helix-turn-helix domain-containing protein [Panacagrimonas sp.]
MMSQPAGLRALDAFRSAIPMHPQRANRATAMADLDVCAWKTPWIRGFELQANDDLVLAFHREGHCDVRALSEAGPSEVHSAPGQLTLIPSGTESRFQVAGEVSFETIHIPSERVLGVAKRHSLILAAPDFRFAFRDSFVGACIDAMLGEAADPGPKSEEFIRSVTDSMVLHLLRFGSNSARRTEAPPRPSAPVERTRALIESSLAEGLSLEELAEEAGVSRSHFARRFRAETGVSPHRYQSQQRIEKAKTLLRETRMNLVDIAIDLGFCSQSHFTQVFRALAGITPRKYREMT